MLLTIWIFLTFALLQIWLILYMNNKKMIFSIPYLLIIFISPFYILLDQNFFVEIFGCGCVPITQTNMFNIPFNANDLRLVIYSILIIISTIIGFKLSKRFNNKFFKIVYVLLILVFNILFSLFINYISAWG